MEHTTHRTWAEIDPAALVHNIRVLRSRVGPRTGAMAIVKANAYGHGMDLVAPALRDEVEFFGVANLAEAAALRLLVAQKPILILGPALPAEREAIVRQGFIPSISDFAEAEAFDAAASAAGLRAPVHLIIDTGMGRIGVWEEDAPPFVRAIHRLPHLKISGIASHLPVADEDEGFTDRQLARFWELVAALRQEGLDLGLVHIDNSAGALVFPERAGDLIRAGLAIYGSSPVPRFQAELRPVLTWKAGVTLVRDVAAGRGISYGRTFITPHPMRIATLGLGYADGYPRHLSGRGAEVLLGGTRCAVLGRVTMDQILVDVSAVPATQAGDVAVILGPQGASEILASEMAAKAGTIPWDIFTGIGTRVHRRLA